jgi:hypothetical protein
MPTSPPSAARSLLRRGLLATALILGDALLTGCQAVLFSDLAPQPCATTTL